MGYACEGDSPYLWQEGAVQTVSRQGSFTSDTVCLTCSVTNCLSSAIPTWTAIMWSTSKRIKVLKRVESIEDEICGGEMAEDKSVRRGGVQGTGNRKGQRIWKWYHMIYDMILYDIWYDMIWYDMIWYDMIWYDMIWYDMIWYDAMRCDAIQYDTIRYDMIWYDMIRYDMIWYYMIWYDMIWYDMIWYDIFVNCNRVDTRWQLYSTHLHTNST